MSIETIPAPAMPVATGTYTTAAQASANYTTTAGTTSGNNKTLAMRIFWPNVDDPTIPLPLVVYQCTLGWAVSDSTAGDSVMEDFFVSCGCIYVTVGTRVLGDDPLSVGESSSMTSMRRAMRANVLDLNTGLRYALANYSEHANGVIEPSMIFLTGTSAGAISSMAYNLIYPSHPIAGVINFSGAFGAENISGTSYTSNLRGDLRYRETHYKTPTCAFVGGGDTIIGTSYIDSLRTKLATNSSNIVHYDSDGGHQGPGGFDVTALTDASTSQEAVSNFLVRRCQSIQPVSVLRKNRAAWAKNWLKLESRYQ